MEAVGRVCERPARPQHNDASARDMNLRQPWPCPESPLGRGVPAADVLDSAIRSVEAYRAADPFLLELAFDMAESIARRAQATTPSEEQKQVA